MVFLRGFLLLKDYSNLSIYHPSMLIINDFFDFNTRKWNIPFGTLARYTGPKEQKALNPGSLVVLNSVSDGPEYTTCSGRAFYSQENPNWWGNEQDINPIYLEFVMNKENFERVGLAYKQGIGPKSIGLAMTREDFERIGIAYKQMVAVETTRRTDYSVYESSYRDPKKSRDGPSGGLGLRESNIRLFPSALGTRYAVSRLLL